MSLIIALSDSLPNRLIVCSVVIVIRVESHSVVNAKVIGHQVRLRLTAVIMNQDISGPRTLRINTVRPRAPNTKKPARTDLQASSALTPTGPQQDRTPLIAQS